MPTDNKKNKTTTKRGTTTINISREVHEELKKFADKDGRKVGPTADKAIKKFLEEETTDNG